MAPHEDVNNALSTAQTLPPEILALIFQTLATSAYLHSFRYTHFKGIRPIPLLSTIIAEAYYSLYAITLSCRAWSTVGTRFLYSCPPLVTGYKVDKFKRSLDHAPFASQYLRELVVVNIDDMNRLRSSPVSPFTDQAAKECITRADLTSILDDSINLDTLTLSLQSYSMRNTSWLLQANASVCSRLRKLTLYGQTLHISFDQLDLPVLEILCLRNFPYFDARSGMPSLPNLRILQFAYSFVTKLVQKRFSSNEKYPRLQAIEFYSTGFGIDGISDHLLNRIPSLSRLHFIGGREVCLFTEMIERGMPIGVEHLVLGILSPLIPPLSEWNIHPNLVSLTVFVGDQINEAFEAIRDCLTFNAPSLSAGCFRTLALYVTLRGVVAALVEGQPSHSQEDLMTTPCFQDISRLCSTHGIDLRCQVLDLSNWVTNWLYDTQPKRSPSLG